MTSADAAGRDDSRDDEDRLELDESQIASAASPAASAEQLELGDDDVRLPWLQSDDDEEDDFQGYSAGQMISLVLLGLLAVAVIGGGIWWATRPARDDALVAEGGIIEAPDEPYKQRPADPGGKTFEGTGDTSFAVSEGQTRPPRLGQADAPAAPPVPAPPPTPPAKAAAPDSAAPDSAADVPGVGVQVGAYSTRSSAEAGWTRLSQQYQALSAVRHRIVEGKADIGTVYRLQAVTPDAAGAQALCRTLRGAGLACQVKN